MKKKITMIDLFCGAGGFSLGFEQTGHFEILGAFDSWDYACKTFRHNHPQYSESIAQSVDLSEVVTNGKRSKVFNRTKIKRGDVDVIIGGPPCQGLSLAGKRIGKDPRNSLFLAYAKMVEILQPKIFVMENVVGLLTAHSGKIKKAIEGKFSELGYSFVTHDDPTILKAECYGVPQFRRRLFFVGFSKNISVDNIVWPPPISHLKYNGRRDNNKSQLPLVFSDDNDLLPPVTVKEAVSDLPMLKSGEGANEMDYSYIKKSQLSEYQKSMRDWTKCPDKKRPKKVYNHEAPKHTQKLIQMIIKAKQGESVDPNYADSRRWDPNAPSFTVKALGAGGGSTNRRAFHYAKETPRGSTVRENARVQSFPDWYEFLGPKTHQMSLVGNSVPPLLSQAIAKSLLQVL